MIDGAEICLESRLGAGHFGEAWLATFHGADVVVKRLKAAPSEDDEKACSQDPTVKILCRNSCARSPSCRRRVGTRT